jgi:hypothetical protein
MMMIIMMMNDDNDDDNEGEEKSSYQVQGWEGMYAIDRCSCACMSTYTMTAQSANKFPHWVAS